MHVNSASVNLCGRLGRIYHGCRSRFLFPDRLFPLQWAAAAHTFPTKFSTIQRLINRKAIRTVQIAADVCFQANIQHYNSPSDVP